MCLGAIAGCDLDASEEDLDSLVEKTPLLVPLPPAYAEKLKKRGMAYENWQKTIQVVILLRELQFKVNSARRV